MSRKYARPLAAAGLAVLLGALAPLAIPDNLSLWVYMAIGAMIGIMCGMLVLVVWPQ